MKWMARPWWAAVSAVALAWVLGWSAPEAQALAIGRITVHSALGQALRAEVDILNLDPAEAASLRVGIASPDSFRAAGMDYHAILQTVRISVVRRSDGRTVLELASDRPVNEPFIDLIIETNWATGRLLRGYTLLFDPPKLPPPEPAVAVAPRISSPPPAVAAPVAAPVASPTPAPPVAPPTQAPQAERRAAVGTATRQLTVQRGDTAGRIASANKATNLSLDQMLVAMLRANPEAFADGNLNRLKAGSILNLPSSSEASAIPRQEARREVTAHSRDFSEFRKKLAETAPSAPSATGDRQASGTVKAKVEDQKTAGVSTDKLTLSKGTTQAAVADKATQDRQATETSTRVAELSKNIGDLNQVKSTLSAASAPAATTATGSSTAPSVAVAAPSASAPVAAPLAAPTPAVAATPVAAKPAAPAPSLIDQLLGNPLMLGGAALLLLLLGLAAVMARRKKAVADEKLESSLESRLQPESFFKASGHSVDTRAAPAGSSMMYSPSQLDSGGDVDPVAEAEVYLAYGRDIQAEEILREALRLNPTRVAIHLKLLEILAKRRDLKGFEVVAREAHDLAHGEGQEWAVASRMGRQLDPSNGLYQAAGSAAPPEMKAPAAAAPLVALAQDEIRTPAAAVPKASAPTEPMRAANQTSTEDFDLDLEAQFAQAIAESPPPSPVPEAQQNADQPAASSPEPKLPVNPAPAEDQDMMISLDLGDAMTPSATPSPAAPAVAPAPSEGMIEFDMGGLSLDLDGSAAPAATTKASNVEAAPQAELADDELTTKFALAEEFQAIGDDDGARQLLEEVIAQASGELKTRAQQALAKLG